MAQLVVRRVEDALVARLRRRAARHGVSMEEEHRRILRDTLAPGSMARARTLKEYLATIPEAGDDTVFDRRRAKPRRVRL
jgi:plasmid stability protein